MARSSGGRHAAFESLYAVDRQTGEVLEVWYAHRVLAESFGTSAGWFWWQSQPGCPPEMLPIGPFNSSYRDYRDAVDGRRRRGCGSDRS